MVSPVLVALDYADLEKARDLASRLTGHVAGFKVGLELLMSEGPVAVTEIARLGHPVFADAKLHDIPNTVRGAAAGLSRAGARWVSVHASGGGHMLEAAVDGMATGSGDTNGVLAVTVLTSIDESDLESIGFVRSMPDQVSRLVGLAAETGVEGVICSPLEVELAKRTAPALIAVTPGIRTVGTSPDDQKRATTPRSAVEKGADLVVIGRSITAAPDPVAVVAEIAETLADIAD